MSWHNESRRHALASRGIKTSVSDKNFNLSRYEGRWYEVGRYPQSFQEDCKTSIADYEERDGEIIVTNTCKKKGGGIRSIKGIATQKKGKNLSVEFFPFIKSPYKIEYVDKNYERAVVGNPNKDSLWLLSRKKNPSSQEINKLITIAEVKGYDKNKLVGVKK